jgi:hypothetical protein
LILNGMPLETITVPESKIFTHTTHYARFFGIYLAALSHVPMPLSGIQLGAIDRSERCYGPSLNRTNKPEKLRAINTT